MKYKVEKDQNLQSENKSVKNFQKYQNLKNDEINENHENIFF